MTDKPPLVSLKEAPKGGEDNKRGEETTSLISEPCNPQKCEERALKNGVGGGGLSQTPPVDIALKMDTLAKTSPHNFSPLSQGTLLSNQRSSSPMQNVIPLTHRFQVQSISSLTQSTLVC